MNRLYAIPQSTYFSGALFIFMNSQVSRIIKLPSVNTTFFSQNIGICSIESLAMSSSENGSDSEPEFESIIATRARRSNAGSRLRQLLDLEETNAGLQALNEDDENVNLLFEEEEDDQEFMESENSNNEDDDEQEEEEHREITKKPVRKSKNLEVVNNDENDNDEMLSNSDVSESDSDEEEGERELQRQEKLSRSRKRRANLIPGVTTKKQKAVTSPKKIAPINKIPKPTNVNTAPIAPNERRHSSRRATIKNSIETHEKMEKEFEKRQSIVPIAKKEYVEKTLEERLEEAKITEKANVLSLTNFYQQEVQKKKKQRDLANARKFKMTEFIRFWSKKLDLTPLDEINEIREEEERIREEEEKKAKRKLQYLKRKQARLGIKSDDIQSDPPSSAANNEGTPKGENSKEDKPKKGTSEESTLTKGTPKEDTPKEEVNNGEEDNKSEEHSQPLKSDNITESTTEVRNLRSKNVQFSEEVTISENGKTEETIPLVKAEEDNEPENIPGETKPELVYEGPFRRVARDYVIFEEFDYDLTIDEAKEYLFGRQSLLSGSRRDPKCETISIIKRNENSNFDLQKIQALRNESFKQLLKLPKFGEKIEITNNNDGKLTLEENELVKINTPAPVGINLPNGQKKTCLITGEPAMYYDPTNGVPYATVDAFRILKNIVDGEYQWLQLDNGGINSRFPGGIGCYIGHKNQRHAKDVPDGF